MKDLVREGMERGYSESRVAWESILFKLSQHKEELLVELQSEAEENAHGNVEQARIERQAAEELLRMNPEEVEKMLRNYDIFTREHESILEDPEIGFRLEAQRHWLPQLISKVREL